MQQDKDFTPQGNKIEGPFENDRNQDNSQLFKDVIKEVFNSDALVGHHIVYELREKRDDGFTYTIMQEIPSADALIFDHDIAKKLWGEAKFADRTGWTPKYLLVLQELVALPVPERDAYFADLFYREYPVYRRVKAA